MCAGPRFRAAAGVHAVGGDRRQDFDAWPGDLAITSPNVGIFSESGFGGEYLTLHVTRAASELNSNVPMTAPRSVIHGDRRAVQLGWRLRRLTASSGRITIALSETYLMWRRQIAVPRIIRRAISCASP
jgi:hypothetical protein